MNWVRGSLLFCFSVRDLVHCPTLPRYTPHTTNPLSPSLSHDACWPAPPGGVGGLAATATATARGLGQCGLGGTSPGNRGAGCMRASSTRAAMAAGSSPIQWRDASRRRAWRAAVSSARTADTAARQAAPRAAAAADACDPAAALSLTRLATPAFLAALAATAATWRVDARATRTWRAASAWAALAAPSAAHCFRRAGEGLRGRGEGGSDQRLVGSACPLYPRSRPHKPYSPVMAALCAARASRRAGPASGRTVGLAGGAARVGPPATDGTGVGLLSWVLPDADAPAELDRRAARDAGRARAHQAVVVVAEAAWRSIFFFFGGASRRTKKDECA